jgi:predicted alpha/beta superfamily hydrolase
MRCTPVFTWFVALLVPLACTDRATADPAPRQTITFSISQTTSPGQAVWVMGDRLELGDSEVRHAVKLRPTAYPTWSIDISLPASTAFTYQFFVGGESAAQIENPANFTPVTAVLNGATDPVAPDPATKTVIADLTMTAPKLYFRQPPGSGPYSIADMWPIAPGPSGGGEQRFAVRDIAVGNQPIEFFIFQSAGSQRVPSTGTFTTDLDRFLLRNLNLYTYEPAAIVNNQSKDYNPASPPAIFSPGLGENRPYRVVLPRGYHNHPTRHYPVLYLHDGQNVFDPGPFGSWDADETAAELTRLAQMREVIMVGIDNTANRIRDYITPDDIVPAGPGTGSPGRADVYANFVITQLKPHIDATYRTIPDRDHTAILGSSLGGVCSLYFGWDFSGTFARCAPFSGSWWLANFPARVAAQPARDLRIYLDAGTSNDGYANAIMLRDNLIAKPYTLEQDLRFRVGIFQGHNEAAWADRLPEALTFLFPATEAPDELAHIVTARKGDVDNNNLENIEDLYAFERTTGIHMDVNRDGAPATAADRAELHTILRATELADITAPRG